MPPISRMGGRKNFKIRENVVQNLIKTPQKFGGVTPSKFEVTAHTVKMGTKPGVGACFIIGALIIMCEGILKPWIAPKSGFFQIVRALSLKLLGVTPPNFCGVLMRFWTTFS